MTIDWLKDTITGVKFYPITHEDAVIDSSGNTLSTKISVMERTTNKVTSLSSGSTHTQYPSAKCVFDAINLVSGSVISSYTGLSNLPILNTNNTTSLTASSNETITGTIKLHKVSKTGSYDDLLNKPTIPTIGTLSTTATTTQSTASSESFSNAIKLHKISKTGKYGDLLDKPTLDTASSKPEEYFAGSGHTHAVTITATSENSQILLQPNAKYNLTVGKSSFTFTTPQDTHYTATPVAGVQTATTNATSDVADPYVNIIENSAKSGGIRISGAGGTSVKAKNGVITISSNVTPPSALSSTYAAATDDSSPVGGDSFETSISKLHGLANSTSTALNGKEDKSNKVTNISSGSTDTQYPSAKCVFDAINLVSGSAITSYDLLSNRPRLNTTNTTAQITSGDETLTGLVNLHKVAKTGTYSDLIGTPTIPTVGTLNTNITAAQATATSESLSGTIKLHKVAKTGTYSDLIGTPTIPSPPGTLSTSATTALATASTEALSSAINLHKIAKTGTYSDLIGTPTIPSAPGTLSTTATTAQATASTEALSGTIKLHKIAKTGTYSDLIGKPTTGTSAQFLKGDGTLDSNTYLTAQTQANWTQTGTTQPDYIKNKPTLGTAASKPEEYFAVSGHTHAVTITGTSENSQILLQPNAKYNLTVGKSSFTFTTPQDTHYTAIPVVGVQTATTNATSDVADPYVNIIENSAKSGGIRISGVGGTTVKAKNGVITISSNVTPPSALSSTYAAATDNSSPVSGDSFETSISKLHGLAKSTSTALNGKEDKSNKVTSISSVSTDTQYPSAKCLYDILSDMVAHENTQSTASTPDYDPQTQSVSILEQTLTPEQQAQARENIGVDELIGDIEDVLDEILGSGTTKSQKKLEVIEASGTNLNTEPNAYYHFDDVVTTLAITLPSVDDISHISQVIFNFTTGANPLISFEASPISGIRPNIYANEGFSIDANTTYEINAIYNGNTWVLAAIRIDVTDISS